jgi:carboxymethylenebutenolidase
MTPETYMTLEVSDGTEMRTYVARPGDAPRAGILVFQEAFGVNPYIKSIADRFAAEGYLAIAPELFHRTAPGFEGDYADFASVTPHMQALTVEGIEADARAAHSWLATQEFVNDRIVAIGFCMGGRVSYIANSILPLSAAVSFYGAGFTPELLARSKDISGPMLFFWGGKDTHIPRELWSQIPAALDEAGKAHVTVEMSEAGHGFFCDQRASYSPEASELAWPLVLNFLSQNLS